MAPNPSGSATWKGTLGRAIKNMDPYLVALSLVYVIFSAYWAELSLAKYYAMNAQIYDLGVAMDFAWYFIRNPFSYIGLVEKPILWVIFPLFIPKSYPLILVFQSLFLSFAVFPLYWIGKSLLKNRMAAFLIAVSFFLFPLTAGIYWYDWHYQALFTTLFPLGYYFYIKRHFKAAFATFVLAGFTRFPYFLLVAAFAAILVVEQVYKKRREAFDKQAFRFSLALLLLWLFYAGFLTIKYGAGNPLVLKEMILGGANAHFVAGSSPLLNIDMKIFNLVLIFLPFLGLPWLSKRFAPLTLIYPYVVIFSGYWAYQFPYAFKFQYGPMIIPFLYLGFIDSLASLRSGGAGPVTGKLRGLWKTVSSNEVKFAAVMLIVMALLASVYAPYGPFNTKYTQGYFNVEQMTDINWARYHAVEKVVAMIPPSDPYVITQENIPQVFPRPPLPGIYHFEPYPQVSYLFSDKFLNENGQILLNFTPQGKYYNLNYAIFSFAPDAYNSFNSNLGWSGTPTPYRVAKTFYESGNYGIVAYADGVFLLKKGYTGPIEYYVPYEQFYPGSEFAYDSRFGTVEGGELILTNINKSVEFGHSWYGPYTALGPGEYNATFEVMTNDTSADNQLTLSVVYDYGAVWLGSMKVTGQDFPGPGVWTNFTVTFKLDSFQNTMEFPGWTTNWNGTLAFKGVYLKEIGEPNATYSPQISNS